MIVPLVHLLVNDTIYSSRLPGIDFSKYQENESALALEELREATATELYSLMDKYAHFSRGETLGDFETMDEVCEDLIKKQVATAGKYCDFSAEHIAAFYPKWITDPEDVWEPIINACGVDRKYNEIARNLSINWQKKY